MQTCSSQSMIKGVLTPFAGLVCWFSLSAYLLHKHASPLMDFV